MENCKQIMNSELLELNEMYYFGEFILHLDTKYHYFYAFGQNFDITENTIVVNTVIYM